MNSSIVHIVGANKKVDFEAVAGLAGIGIITLQHKEAFVDHKVCMRGFQGGKINVTTRDGSTTYFFTPYKETDQTDSFTPRNLYFSKDDRTGENLAVIPDTKYNRMKLAKIYFSYDAPKIKEREIDLEVREIAERIRKEVVVQKDKDALMIEDAKRVGEMAKKMEELQKENKRLLERSELLKKTITSPSNTALINYVYKEMFESVCLEKSALIDSIKEVDGWEESDAYRKNVLDEVEARCIEKLKGEGITDVEFRSVIRDSKS